MKPVKLGSTSKSQFMTFLQLACISRSATQYMLELKHERGSCRSITREALACMHLHMLHICFAT